jgi:SAM-dependent methyltransferase
MDKNDFDDYADDYDHLIENSVSFFDSNIDYFADYKVKISYEFCPDAKRILDFGCGIGRSIPFMKKCFPESDIFGFDISRKSIEYASKKNADVTFFSERSEMDSYKSYFDLIFVAGLFHHVSKDQRIAILSQIENILKNNGILIVFEHNPYNVITRFLVDRCPLDTDIELIKASSIIRMFKEIGLTDIYRGYSLFFPGKMKLLRKMEKYMRWLPLGGQYFVIGKKC